MARFTTPEMTATKARIRRSTGDPMVPWALEVPPAWGRPEDVCDGYDPELDGRDHVPGGKDCDHPFMGLYGYSTWETCDIALGHVAEVIRRWADRPQHDRPIGDTHHG